MQNVGSVTFIAHLRTSWFKEWPELFWLPENWIQNAPSSTLNPTQQKYVKRNRNRNLLMRLCLCFTLFPKQPEQTQMTQFLKKIHSVKKVTLHHLYMFITKAATSKTHRALWTGTKWTNQRFWKILFCFVFLPTASVNSSRNADHVPSLLQVSLVLVQLQTSVGIKLREKQCKKACIE